MEAIKKDVQAKVNEYEIPDGEDVIFSRDNTFWRLNKNTKIWTQKVDDDATRLVWSFLFASLVAIYQIWSKVIKVLFS